MKKVILVIISIVLMMIPGCTLNECKIEKMIYKSKEDKVEPYFYNSITRTFMYRNITVLQFETKDKKTIELIDTTNQQCENLKAGEEYSVEYDDDNNICNIDNSRTKKDEDER